MVIYPLVITQIAVERSTIFIGKTHENSMVVFNSYVKLLEGKRMVIFWDNLDIMLILPCFLWVLYGVFGGYNGGMKGWCKGM